MRLPGEEEQAAGLAAGAEHANPAFLPVAFQAALALHRLGRRGAALPAGAEGSWAARRWKAPRAVGVALRVLGLVQGGSGRPAFREAATLLGGSCSTRARAGAGGPGRGVAPRGNRQRKRERRRAGGLGTGLPGGQAGAWSWQAQDEWQRWAPGPASCCWTGESLTPSERRVARMMAAQGIATKNWPRRCSSPSRPSRSTSAVSTASCRSASHTTRRGAGRRQLRRPGTAVEVRPGRKAGGAAGRSSPLRGIAADQMPSGACRADVDLPADAVLVGDRAESVAPELLGQRNPDVPPLARPSKMARSRGSSVPMTDSSTRVCSSRVVSSRSLGNIRR